MFVKKVFQILRFVNTPQKSSVWPYPDFCSCFFAELFPKFDSAIWRRIWPTRSFERVQADCPAAVFVVEFRCEGTNNIRRTTGEGKQTFNNLQQAH